MNGYDFYIFEASRGMRILLTSNVSGEEKSILSFFLPRQASTVQEYAFSDGVICACADEVHYMAFFPYVASGIGFAVRFRPAENTEPSRSLSECSDAVILKLVSVFQRAEHIGITYPLFPAEAIIDARMLLSEYVKLRTVQSARYASSFGFAVFGESKLVVLLVQFIAFLSLVLEDKEKLYVEIADCDGIFRAEIVFSFGLLDELLDIFKRVFGERNVLMRFDGENVTVEIIAAAEDESKLGLKYGIY